MHDPNGPSSSSTIFAPPAPSDPTDPLATPVRSSGAHKHFSRSADTTDNDQLRVSDDVTPEAIDSPVDSIGNYINAFDDDRDDEEIEMDTRLANLKKLGEHSASSAVHDEAPTDSEKGYRY